MSDKNVEEANIDFLHRLRAFHWSIEQVNEEEKTEVPALHLHCSSEKKCSPNSGSVEQTCTKLLPLCTSFCNKTKQHIFAHNTTRLASIRHHALSIACKTTFKTASMAEQHSSLKNHVAGKLNRKRTIRNTASSTSGKDVTPSAGQHLAIQLFIPSMFPR